jgi:hypothetical protein
MLEIIKHLFGFCGEGHQNFLLIGILPTIYFIKLWYGRIILNLNIVLKYLQTFFRQYKIRF